MFSLTLEFLGHPDEVRPVHPGPARHVGEADVGAARQAITADCSVWKVGELTVTRNHYEFDGKVWLLPFNVVSVKILLFG